MILAVGNVKGGVGKTTLAINIAIARSLAGYDVLLVDGDEQGTAITFTDLRIEKNGVAGYTAVGLYSSSLRTQVRQLAGKYDDIIIDVGGRDTSSLRAALIVADMLLIPVQPRSFDIWAIDQVAYLVKEALELNELRAVAVLNAADAQGSDNEEAARLISNVSPIEMLEVSIGRRKAFPNAAALGLSVLEQAVKDHKAIHELASLIHSIYPKNTSV